MDTVEWTAPDEQGNQRCPRHPEVAPFSQSSTGCARCVTDPPPAPSDEPGEGERLCAEAAERGLPDAMMVEDRFWMAWAYQQKRAEKCAARADDLYATGDPDDLDRAIKLEGAAAKWADSSTKAGKIASATVGQRERMASQERAARDVARAKGESN